MRDQSLQPSQIVFPVSLHPEERETAEEGAGTPHVAWGWLEIFVLVQVLWGVLLFVPGSQTYRVYIRGFPYISSLIALFACLRSSRADSGTPGASWILASLALMVASLVHPSTWFMSGIAQIVFQLSIAAPVFWTAYNWVTAERLERVLLLVFGANFLGALLGLLQVYYPETFMPPEFSRLALRLQAELIGSLTYIGADGREILRPPGLSDIPGGAAVSATITALLGFAFATRAEGRTQRRVGFLAAALIGLTVVYLTQIRSMLVMVCVCMIAAGVVRLRQGRVAHTMWIAGSAGALVVASFTWAVAVGGDSVVERFQSILDVGVVQSYQENRGIFLSYTLQELLYEYPFGAGIGRWGMMTNYFGDPSNWQSPVAVGRNPADRMALRRRDLVMDFLRQRDCERHLSHVPDRQREPRAPERSRHDGAVHSGARDRTVLHRSDFQYAGGHHLLAAQRQRVWCRAHRDSR